MTLALETRNVQSAQHSNHALIDRLRVRHFILTRQM